MIDFKLVMCKDAAKEWSKKHNPEMEEACYEAFIAGTEYYRNNIANRNI